jgi:plasmid stabilization system protein ParE
VSRRVVTTPTAEAQIAAIDSWWRAHRTSAPGLFLAELEQGLGLLERMSFAGASYPVSPIAGVRRLLLSESRFHVYYIVADDAVFVLAVWHASRGNGPPVQQP